MVADPITVAVIASALRATADEMSESLRRSSHSPIIREMLDYSCAAFTSSGEIVAQDELIPAFLGAMAATMPYVIAAAGDAPRSGDAWITNDPYSGGTHTPDIQLFVPVLHDGEVIAWCGNIAHHSDVGGPNPGTEGYANRSMFEEGLRIPPVQMVADGCMNQALLDVIEGNIRDPRSTAGDLRAQLAAAKLGQRRLNHLAERYGAPILGAAMETVLLQSERRIRAAISARADGETTAQGWLDDDGLGGDPQRIVAKLTVRADRVSVDLTGTDPQMPGGLNMSATAAKAAIYFVVKAVFDHAAPQDGAVIRVVDITLPEGSLANPRFPAAVSLRHLAVQRLADTLLRAVAELYPDLATAGSFVGFSSLAAAVPHPRLGHQVIVQDDLGGGMGGHSSGDGVDAVDVYLGNVQMLPAEICEREYSVRIVATELVPDSGGAGTFRGGLGIRRIYEFLREADGVFYTEQTREQFAPHGAAGGSPGAAARLMVERVDGTRETIGKERLSLQAGDRLITTTGGGGGYGDPRRRDRAAVRRDLQEDKISERSAREVYGLEAQAILPQAS